MKRFEAKEILCFYRRIPRISWTEHASKNGSKKDNYTLNQKEAFNISRTPNEENNSRDVSKARGTLRNNK